MPFVVVGDIALPPVLLVRTSDDIGRGQIAVLRGVPFRGNLREQ